MWITAEEIRMLSKDLVSIYTELVKRTEMTERLVLAYQPDLQKWGCQKEAEELKQLIEETNQLLRREVVEMQEVVKRLQVYADQLPAAPPGPPGWMFP